MRSRAPLRRPRRRWPPAPRTRLRASFLMQVGRRRGPRVGPQVGPQVGPRLATQCIASRTDRKAAPEPREGGIPMTGRQRRLLLALVAGQLTLVTAGLVSLDLRKL